MDEEEPKFHVPTYSSPKESEYIHHAHNLHEVISDDAGTRQLL